MDAQGLAGGKLRHCPCNANGRPLDCGAACQQKDWAAHREFCTADTSKPAAGKAKGKKGKS